MANLETAIRDRILGDTGIAALVAARVRPMAMGRQDVRPYITTQITNGKSDGYLGGETEEYKKAEFELGIYGDRYDDVVALSTLLKDRLDQCGEVVSGVEFAPIEFDDETDVEEVVPDGEELPIYLRTQTYRVFYKLT